MAPAPARAEQPPHATGQVAKVGFELGVPRTDLVHQHVGQIDRMAHKVVQMLELALGIDEPPAGAVRRVGRLLAQLVHDGQDAHGVPFDRAITPYDRRPVHLSKFAIEDVAGRSRRLPATSGRSLYVEAEPRPKRKRPLAGGRMEGA